MKPMTIPVIHYASDDQAVREAKVAFETGNEGVLLIHMEGRDELIGPIAQRIKREWPERLVGANYLTLNPVVALEENVGRGLDMTWTDKQVTHTIRGDNDEMFELQEMLAAKPQHDLFVGVAFKHQRPEPDPVGAAMRALQHGMIPTTSGPATGSPPTTSHIQGLRTGIGPDAPLAIASGIDPHNAAAFAPLLTHILVATGVSRSFHEFDRDKLIALRVACGHHTAS